MAPKRPQSMSPRGTALLIVGGLLAVAVASTALLALQVCRQRLAQTGDAGVATVCEPVVSEVALLGLALLLIVLILLPLLAKFDIAGLLSIELKADEAKRDAGEAKALAQAVQAQATELAKVQAELRDVQDRLLARSVSTGAEAGTGLTMADVLAGYAGEPETSRPEDAIERLLRAVEDISRYAGIDERGHREKDLANLATTAAGRELLSRWQEMYALEIQQLRALRNEVAHGRVVDRSRIEAGAVLAELLLSQVRDILRTVE